MNKIAKRLLPFLLLLLLVALPACSLSGVLRRSTPTPVEVQVTADQIAQAMQEDEFFSDYRGDMLLVTGKVNAVNQKDRDTRLELETSLPTKVVCELGTQTITAKPGDSVTVQAQAAEAERAPSAVLLKNCRMH